jgi:hypothetical protein
MKMFEGHLNCVAPDGRSRVLLSTDPLTDTAFVFVHGFQGHFEKTWRQFQTMIDASDADDSWHRADLYFFYYEAENNHLAASANALTGY